MFCERILYVLLKRFDKTFLKKRLGNVLRFIKTFYKRFLEFTNIRFIEVLSKCFADLHKRFQDFLKHHFAGFPHGHLPPDKSHLDK